jgi:hypothetical protein
LQDRYALTELFLNTWVTSDSPNPSATNEWDVWDKYSQTTSSSSPSSDLTRSISADQALTNDNLLSSNNVGWMASLTPGSSSSMRDHDSLNSCRSRSWPEAGTSVSIPSSPSPSTASMDGYSGRLMPKNKRQRTSSLLATPVHQLGAGHSLVNSAMSPESSIGERRSSVNNSEIERQTTR